MRTFHGKVYRRNKQTLLILEKKKEYIQELKKVKLSSKKMSKKNRKGSQGIKDIVKSTTVNTLHKAGGNTNNEKLFSSSNNEKLFSSSISSTTLTSLVSDLDMSLSHDIAVTSEVESDSNSERPAREGINIDMTSSSRVSGDKAADTHMDGVEDGNDDEDEIYRQDHLKLTKKNLQISFWIVTFNIIICGAMSIAYVRSLLLHYHLHLI